LAFVGQLLDSDMPPVEALSQSLLWKSFLFAPLLKHAEFVKYSGNDDFRPNDDADDVMGMYMDTFAHHAFIDSGKTFLPADLQGKFRSCRHSLLSQSY